MMNDPHVVSLRYAFRSDDPDVLFDHAAPLECSLGPFDVELREGMLMVHPHDHFPDAGAAKIVFEPYLRSWEGSTLLQSGRYRIRFTYLTAEVVDRNPLPNKVAGIRIQAVAGDLMLFGELAAARLNRAAYPAPDPSFAVSDLTDALLLRFKQYRDQREPLPHMAYWLLDRLEEEYGDRLGVATNLGISRKVLAKLGGLTSDIADPAIGRKAGGEKRLYEAVELQWLEEVVVRLIRRVGEINAAATNLTKITLADFPSI